MANTVRPAPAAPVSGQHRVPEVDILRGFALLGVLLVNLRFMGSPQLYWRYADVAERWPGLVHQVAEGVVQILVLGKFLSLFSFLFGLGFGMMVRRAEEQQSSLKGLYARRLVFLAVFGLLHSFLVWYGDILTTYAILGFLLPLFRRSSDRTLLTWAAMALLVPTALVLAAETVGGPSTPQTPPEALALAERSIHAYRDGGFRAIAYQRAVDVRYAYAQTVPFLTFNFGMFLLGLYAARRGLLTNIAMNRRQWSFLRRWGLLVGLPGNIVAFALLRGFAPAPLFVGVFVFSFAVLALASFYASSIVLMARSGPWKRWLEPLGFVGRMALTNYLLQSVIGTTIFYGYGLGLYASWGPATDIPLALGIFACQVAISRWWLRRFRFGPAEWVWRSLTYWKIQPMGSNEVQYARRLDL
jgi:uncharacterized protein